MRAYPLKPLAAALCLLIVAEAPLSAAAASRGVRGVPAIPSLAMPAVPMPFVAMPAAGVPLAARLQVTAQGVFAAAETLSASAAEDASGAGEAIQRALDGAGDGTLSPGPQDPSGAGGGSGQSREQAMRLRALKQIVDVFDAHYAPKAWKASRGVDFKREYEKARARIEANPAMSRREYQRVLAGFVDAARDYHAGISFYSSEAAKLPLSIVGAEGRYFIGSVDRAQLPEAEFPFQPGDEVLEFGGKPTADAVKALLRAPNTAETDARLAEMQLTARSGRRALAVPQGAVALRIKTADGVVHQTSLTWTYQPEMISPDVPSQGTIVAPETAPDPAAGGGITVPSVPAPGPMQRARDLVRQFLRPMAHPEAEFMAEQAAQDAANGFAMGGKTSFVPPLGPVLWQLPPQIAEMVPFHAYIYKNAGGQRVGYVRIPDYMADGKPAQAAQIFAQLMVKYQQETDALVIDQVNNPGGNMFYMYQLLAFLASKPMAVPPHRMLLGEAQAKLALDILKQAKSASMKDLIEQAIKEQLFGFQAPPTGQDPIVAFAEFILDQFSVKKKRLSDEVQLFGIGEIPPHPQASYTKPIVVLINELDFSGGDFFPAILQANNRATLFGVRTAGAGGAVQAMQWPNELGIESLAYTWTIALRAKGGPIENLGVTPEVPYQITAKDLRDGFQDYAQAVNDTVAKILKGAPQAP